MVVCLGPGHRDRGGVGVAGFFVLLPDQEDLTNGCCVPIVTVLWCRPDDLLYLWVSNC